jgi:hypothetical protein
LPYLTFKLDVVGDAAASARRIDNLKIANLTDKLQITVALHSLPPAVGRNSKEEARQGQTSRELLPPMGGAELRR